MSSKKKQIKQANINSYNIVLSTVYASKQTYKFYTR